MAGPRGKKANLISHEDYSNTLLVSEPHFTTYLSVQEGDASHYERLQGSDCSSQPPPPLMGVEGTTVQEITVVI